MHAALVFVAALVAGAIASLSGFGIGSILTPLLAVFLGTKLAVAVVSFPHFIGTALRFALVHRHLDRRVLWSFGVTSAIGGLVGALLHVWLRSALLGYLLGALLVFAGLMGLTGLSARMHFGRTAAWLAGALSGIFGGLVGNQGGIRSGALLAFNIPKESLVATATAIALFVDLFRMPVYLATESRGIASASGFLCIASIGVVVGTLIGKPLLERIPEKTYKMLLSLLILALGVWLFIHPGA